MSDDKTLNVVSLADAAKKVSDIEVYGNGDSWKLICKASSESQGWMKSTKALYTGNGCLVQVTTQQRNPDSSYCISESVTYAPGICIDDREPGNLKLVPIKR